MTTKLDPVLGPVRRCSTCKEWWPDDEEFFYPDEHRCRACLLDKWSRYRDAMRATKGKVA